MVEGASTRVRHDIITQWDLQAVAPHRNDDGFDQRFDTFSLLLQRQEEEDAAVEEEEDAAVAVPLHQATSMNEAASASEEPKRKDLTKSKFTEGKLGEPQKMNEVGRGHHQLPCIKCQRMLLPVQHQQASLPQFHIRQRPIRPPLPSSLLDRMISHPFSSRCKLGPEWQLELELEPQQCRLRG